ncbi:hypothetical protein [Streptomyces sp. NPDC056304]
MSFVKAMAGGTLTVVGRADPAGPVDGVARKLSNGWNSKPPL